MLRLAVVMTVAVAVAVAWAGSALASGAAPGTLELCKSSLNGMSGKTFTYTVTPSGGSAIGVTVKGGRCSGPIQIAGGNATILEQASDPATDVAAVRVTPSARLVSQDLVARKAVVSVPVGSTVANETRVTFVNQPAGGNFGDLKICKLSETPAFVGKNFSFKVNGGSAISVEAGDAFADPASWSCRLGGHFQVGSKVTVQELVPNEAQVAWIDTDPVGALTDDYSTSDGHAVVTIGAGMTIVMYDDEPFVPQGNGYIEVCKDRALLDYNQYDWDVHGSFHFTITDQLGTVYQRDVLVGQCSEPIQVAAGIATVTEGPSAYQLVDVWTLPEDRLQTTNLLNGTADVEIPVSDDPNDETQVHFVNKTPRAQLKICKALGAGSSDLVNTAFYFDVTYDGQKMNTLDLYPFKIVAGTTTQCKIWGDLPVGTDVTVHEDLQRSVDMDAQYIDVTGQDSTITIAPGINTVTITNQAMGQLEVCKARIEFLDKDALKDAAQPFIQFLVDGKKIPLVRAGRCSMPLRVTVGNHTVVESSYQAAASNLPSGSPVAFGSAASNYELDQGGTVNIPLLGIPYSYNTPGNGIDVSPASALVSKNLTTRTATVSVPYGKYGETLVTYYNRIRKGRVKICKQIPSTSLDSLGGKTFTFHWKVGNGGRGKEGDVTLAPGECSYVFGDFNLIDSDANAVPVTVKETQPGLDSTFVIDPQNPVNVQFSRGVITLQTNANNETKFNLGPDTNVVTYTNRSIDP
jgi:hypothetical protein